MLPRVALPMLALVLAIPGPFSFCQENLPSTLSFIVQKLEQAQSVAPHCAYNVIRDYHLSGANSSPIAEVTAELNYRPPNQKKYVIRKSSGSNRGEQVVKQILDHEVEVATRNLSSAAGVTSVNYNFTYLGERTDLGERYIVLGLKPKRKDKNLVSGFAWVDESSFRVRHIEGDLAQSPSWWIKKVHVAIDFANLAGAWQQSHMEAVADVRFIGVQRLQSETAAETDTLQALAVVHRHRGAPRTGTTGIGYSPD